MAQGRYGGVQKRRSPRHNKRFKITLSYDGKTYEIRTVNISKHGVLLPRCNPPPVGSHIKLTLTIMNETSIFEGIVIRHADCLVNGAKTTGIGIDITSPEYYEFIKDKIIIY